MTSAPAATRSLVVRVGVLHDHVDGPRWARRPRAGLRAGSFSRALPSMASRSRSAARSAGPRRPPRRPRGARSRTRAPPVDRGPSVVVVQRGDHVRRVERLESRVRKYGSTEYGLHGRQPTPYFRTSATPPPSSRALPHQPLDARRPQLPNRVVLAPLAGIGNWFVRLQAQAPRRRARGVRDGVELRPRATATRAPHREFLRIHPDEHPVSMQLFGHDADGDARGGRDGGRGRRRPDRPQHGLPGAQGLQDRRGRGAARRSRPGGGDRPRGARGQRPAGHREAPPGPRARATAPASTLARRLVEEAGVAGIALPPAPRLAAALGRARLRARARARRGAAGAGDPLRRPLDEDTARRAFERERRRGGDAGPRLARQPLALRAPARRSRRRADRRGGRSTSSTG